MKRRKDSKNNVLREGESERKDGRYQYRYSLLGGKRGVIYGSTLKELREKEKDLEKDKYFGIKSQNTIKTINDMYNRWIMIKRGIKASTLSNYKYLYEHYVQEEFGNMKLKDVKKSDICRFYCSLVDNNKLSVRTIECLQIVIFQIFELAVDDELIIKNPASKAVKELTKMRDLTLIKKEALAFDEECLLIEYLKGSKKFNQWYSLIVVMLRTGLRFGEVCGLRWCDVDFEANTISVNHTAYYYDKYEVDSLNHHCGFSIQSPKTSTGRRDIPMLPEVKEAFEIERNKQTVLGIKSNVEIDGYKDFIFVNKEGKLHNQVAVNRALKAIARWCNKEIDAGKICNNGVYLPEQTTCHILRHTFATRLNERGVNVKVMQEILGHKDITTTMNIYTDAKHDFINEEMKKMETVQSVYDTL